MRLSELDSAQNLALHFVIRVRSTMESIGIRTLGMSTMAFAILDDRAAKMKPILGIWERQY